MVIYVPKGNAREYSPLAINYLSHCDFGCEYCFGTRLTNMQNKQNKGCKQFQVIKPTSADWLRIENSAKHWIGCNEQILLSFLHDPYCDAEIGETRRLLNILNQYGHKVSILTKNPEKALGDLDIMKDMGDRFKIGTTLTFDNDPHSLKFEPNAPLPQSRFEAMKEFEKQGIITWVSFEPVIMPTQSLNLLRQVVGFIDHVKVGKVNHFGNYSKQINWAQFLADAVQILRYAGMNDRFYIKNDLSAYNQGIYLSANETDQDWLNL